MKAALNNTSRLLKLGQRRIGVNKYDCDHRDKSEQADFLAELLGHAIVQNSSVDRRRLKWSTLRRMLFGICFPCIDNWLQPARNFLTDG